MSCVETLEARVLPCPDAPLLVSSYGCIDCGLELMRASWQRLTHVFSIRRQTRPSDIGGPEPLVVLPGPSYPLNLLRRHPVDVLVVERGHVRKPGDQDRTELLVDRTPPSQRPKLILHAYPSAAVGWGEGPTE